MEAAQHEHRTMSHNPWENWQAPFAHLMAHPHLRMDTVLLSKKAPNRLLQLTMHALSNGERPWARG